MLELRGLRKRYDTVVALDGVDLTAHEGRLVGFLGPNGAGKTTTMRSVFGLVGLDAGTVSWRGAQIDADARLAFGYLPEERGLYPRMAIGRQLSYFGELHGASRRDADAAAMSWLERLGLADRAGDRVDQLSHGNQQRVQLAAALVHEPDLLVLDEPFTGLDPIGVDDMIAVLREQAARGVAVVFSSHQLELVEDLCDDVTVIARGQVVLEGSLDEVRASAHHRLIRIALPDPAALTVPVGADVVERGDHHLVLRVAAADGAGRVLAAAASAGVTAFMYEPPTLTEVFREAVAAAGLQPAVLGDGGEVAP